jgi:hypothetical protein
MSGPARRAKRTARPEKSEEQKAAEQYEQQLKDAGGHLWMTDDLSKKRIYFNDVIRDSDGKRMSVFYDCKEQRWQTGKYADEFVAIIRERINL